jgi:hypothetical protein
MDTADPPRIRFSDTIHVTERKNLEIRL